MFRPLHVLGQQLGCCAVAAEGGGRRKAASSRRSGGGIGGANGGVVWALDLGVGVSERKD